MSTYVAEAFCQACGCLWFVPEGYGDPWSTPTTCLGAIKVDGAGRVIAYNGVLECYDCGEPWHAPQVSSIPTELTPEVTATMKESS